MPDISFRPHHFLCTLSFQGKGYTPGFVDNFRAIVQRLQHDENTVIQVTAQTDSICNACPHKNEHTCLTEAKIQRLDQAHATILNLKDKDRLTWKKAKNRLKNQMTIAHFHKACASCPWKRFGICEKALRQLQESVDSCYSEAYGSQKRMRVMT